MTETTHEDFGITSIHIDERNRSVTITCRHEGLPDDAPTEWREQGFNSYEQTVMYTTVDGLGIDGWDNRPATTWTSTDLSDSRITVTLTGPGTSIHFQADALPRHTRRGLLSGSF